MMAVAVGARASRSVRGVACPRPPQASGFLVCVGRRAVLRRPGPGGGAGAGGRRGLAGRAVRGAAEPSGGAGTAGTGSRRAGVLGRGRR